MIKRLIRRTLGLLDRLALPFAAAARGLASAYYLIANPRFGREHRAVAAGRRAYLRTVGSAARSNPLLRRNVHRLEKGLIMQPRSLSFAADYIGETVDAFRMAEASGVLDGEEERWARDVLDRYFASVADVPAIAAARARYTARDARAADEAYAPRPRSAGARASVEYPDFLELCRQRRSVRWFLPTPVPRALVEQAVAAAAQAPSACNRQPFLFRYFERPEDARRIAAVPMGTTGYSQNLQALIVIVGDLGAFAEERDRHLIYIDAALAAMQLMLALETLGLASCPINWPDVESLERRMARELKLPYHVRPIMLIAIGYADPGGGVPYSAKKPFGSLLRDSDDYTT